MPCLARWADAASADFWPPIQPIATFGPMAPWAQQILDAANEHYVRAEYPLAQPYYEKLVQQGLRYPDVVKAQPQGSDEDLGPADSEERPLGEQK